MTHQLKLQILGHWTYRLHRNKSSDIKSNSDQRAPGRHAESLIHLLVLPTTVKMMIMMMMIMKKKKTRVNVACTKREGKKRLEIETQIFSPLSLSLSLLFPTHLSGQTDIQVKSSSND